MANSTTANHRKHARREAVAELVDEHEYLQRGGYPAERDECARLFVRGAIDDLAVVHRLSAPDRPIDPEKLQFVIWRARKALDRLELLVDATGLRDLYERGLRLEAASNE